MHSGLPALRSCILQVINEGFESLFWFDRWVASRVFANLWLEEFCQSLEPYRSVRDLAHLLFVEPFVGSSEAGIIFFRLITSSEANKDMKWSLLVNGRFSVKSYNFLNDGGTFCLVAKFFWKGPCSSKINILNWLVWNDKVLSLKNLTRRRCNQLPTSTYDVPRGD